MDANQLWILNFHGIGDLSETIPSDERPVWVELGHFEDALAAFGERTDVRFTFDDGNASDAELALPRLAERGLCASFFPCAGRIDEKGYCSAAQLRALADAGMTIGSHGWDHRPWRGLRGAALDRELAEARARLQDVTGQPVDTAACPFGAYDRRVLDALSEAGFSRVYTSDGGPARAEGWLQARLTVKAGEGPERIERRIAEARRPVAHAARRVRGLLKRLR